MKTIKKGLPKHYGVLRTDLTGVLATRLEVTGKGFFLGFSCGDDYVVVIIDGVEVIGNNSNHCITVKTSVPCLYRFNSSLKVIAYQALSAGAFYSLD